jgi:hypothetical protein
VLVYVLQYHLFPGAVLGVGVLGGACRHHWFCRWRWVRSPFTRFRCLLTFYAFCAGIAFSSHDPSVPSCCLLPALGYPHRCSFLLCSSFYFSVLPVCPTLKPGFMYTPVLGTDFLTTFCPYSTTYIPLLHCKAFLYLTPFIYIVFFYHTVLCVCLCCHIHCSLPCFVALYLPGPSHTLFLYTLYFWQTDCIYADSHNALPFVPS